MAKNNIDACDNAADLERKSYRRDSDTGDISVAVTDDAKGPLTGINWDAVSVAYPSNTVEEWSFFSGGTSGTLQATVTLTFSDSTKCSLTSLETVYP